MSWYDTYCFKTLIMQTTNYVCFFGHGTPSLIKWMLYLPMHTFSNMPFPISIKHKCSTQRLNFLHWLMCSFILRNCVNVLGTHLHLQQTSFGSLILLKHPPYSSFQKTLQVCYVKNKIWKKKKKKYNEVLKLKNCYWLLSIY